MTKISNIFSPLVENKKQDPVQTKKPLPILTQKIKTPVQVKEEAKPKARKERSDKRKSIKFPVTPTERKVLREIAKNSEVSQPKQKNETISNTHLLLKAIEHESLYPEYYPELLYKDTKQYMNVKPLARDFDKVEELAFKWNCSRREATYRLIMNYIFAGEVKISAANIEKPSIYV